MLAAVKGRSEGLPQGGSFRHEPEPPAAHQDAGEPDAVGDLYLSAVLHPVGKPAQLAAAQAGADMVYQGLLSAVAEDVLDLTPAGKDRDAELDELVGQKVGILRHRVDALGRQPHNAGPARQNGGRHEGVF